MIRMRLTIDEFSITPLTETDGIATSFLTLKT